MEIVFYCIQDGQSFYRVVLNGKQIFLGTKDECGRFIEIHNQKVEDERLEHQRVPRNRPVSVRTFRRLRAHA